jgi:hypothetical protein
VDADGPTLLRWSFFRYAIAGFLPPKSCMALMSTAVPSPATPGVEYCTLFSYVSSVRSSQVLGALPPGSSFLLWMKPK